MGVIKTMILENMEILEAVSGYDDMSFVLKLNNIKMKGIQKTISIPGIEEYSTQKSGRLFGVKYMFHPANNNSPKMIRISSQDKSFRTIYSIDIYDKKLNPGMMFFPKPDMPKDKVISFIGDIVVSTKFVKPKGRIKESEMPNEITLDDKVLNEMSGDVAIILFYAGLMGLMIVINIIVKYRYYFTKVGNWMKEKYIAGPAEQRQNEVLFMGQRGDEPAYAIYQNLVNYIKHVTSGRANAIIICGPPGMSKTFTVRRTFHFMGLKPLRDYNIVKGSALTLGATYEMLYQNRNRILVLDDFDTPLKNLDMVNMLKAVTDSYEKRIFGNSY